MSEGQTRAALRRRIEKAGAGDPLDRASAVALAEHLETAPRPLLAPLLEAASALGRQGHGRVITVSRNVFIPLTNLCRDRCAYCTFAKDPRSPEARTYALEDVRTIARSAYTAGCLEALFCLGDKPELAYRGYRSWLASQGYPSTARYLEDACAVALAEGIFPHTNAGILTREEMARLRPHNSSMGLMLESISPRLRQRGQAHYYCPDKDPELRLRMTREAGELGIPFTSGLLIGIGETPAERIDTLLAIRDLAREGGHIQEVIVQSFHPKPDTHMADWPRASDETLAATVALARLIFGPRMNLQAPPNLAADSIDLLIRSGLNDWGGVSPLTVDYINPEAPWPALDELRRRTEASGYVLRERLAVYPEFIRERPGLFDPDMLRRLRSVTDSDGYPVEIEAGRHHAHTSPPAGSAPARSKSPRSQELC